MLELGQPAGGKVHYVQEKSGVGECFEGEEMFWEGMIGRSWSALIQQ